jgi:hypothetical protein
LANNPSSREWGLEFSRKENVKRKLKKTFTENFFKTRLSVTFLLKKAKILVTAQVFMHINFAF